MMRSLVYSALALALNLQGVWCVPAAAAATSDCVDGRIAGTSCEAQCGVDHPGSDYASLRAATFQACVDACSSDARCVIAQWNSRRSYCYLKRAINQAKTTPTIDSVVCRPCPTGNFRIQLVTNVSGRARYLLNTGETSSPARNGQVSAFPPGSRSTVYYLNGTTPTSTVQQADGTRSVLYARATDGYVYAETLARNALIGYELLQASLAPNVDKCGIGFRTPSGNTGSSISSDDANEGVAFYVQDALSRVNFPVRVYAVPA